MEEYLILVDEADKPSGKAEKMEVHRLGLLHRAFSIFIFNTKGELLLQQRATSKYHSAGLWTNTCCSHPRYGEEVEDAVSRRLNEEMGLVAATNFLFRFTYKSVFDNGLTEHEVDHVFWGISDAQPQPHKDEVMNWKYMSLVCLKKDMLEHPKNYSSWLQICFDKVFDKFNRFPFIDETSTEI